MLSHQSMSPAHPIDDPLSAGPPLSRKSFDRFAVFITSELGIKMPDSKLVMVQSRLLRRVRDLGLASIDQYADYFFSSTNAEEREHFINAITTNKTDFFREPQHFAFLMDVAVPAFDTRANRRFKVWSAGCSSGEEPWTLAMVLAEYAVAHHGFDFAILATDVSTRMLKRARAAVYQESQVLPVPPRLRVKYLLRGRHGQEPAARVIPELRRKVSFHHLNFMDEEYRIREVFDAVFFRNVLIYFDRPTQEAVVNRVCCHLASGGYLFAGHSESLAGLNIPVRSVRASVYRKVVS